MGDEFKRGDMKRDFGFEMFNQSDAVYIFVLFAANVISMILELVAARILSPVIGSSNLLWTIIIGMMLFSNAIGNFIGGMFSEKKNLDILNVMFLLVSAFSMEVIAVFDRLFLSRVTQSVSDSQISHFLLTILLFMIPCICFGAMSPVVNKQFIRESDNVGKRSGFIYTVITAGSLFGTLFGGFYLIPHFGMEDILYYMSGFCLIMILVVMVSALTVRVRVKENGVSYDMKFKAVLSLVLVFALFVSLFTVRNHYMLMNNSDMVIINTGDSYIRIYNGQYKGDDVKFMNISGGYSSANFLDPEKRDELVYWYTGGYNTVLDKYPEAEDFLMIGGAGYSYPRYLLSHYADKKIDVVEIDGGITQAAMDHYYLGDFIKEYGTDRLGLYTEDGRIFLNETDRRYDVILNDAFSGGTPARSLCTKEAYESAKRCLNGGGIYAANIIVHHNDTKFLRSELKTMSTVFEHVWLVTPQSDKSSYNTIVIASDTDYGFKSEPYTIDDDAVLFTDDYAPVEYIIGNTRLS